MTMMWGNAAKEINQIKMLGVGSTDVKIFLVNWGENICWWNRNAGQLGWRGNGQARLRAVQWWWSAQPDVHYNDNGGDDDGDDGNVGDDDDDVGDNDGDDDGDDGENDGDGGKFW